MKATEIKYLKRFNLGDYQHEEFGVTLSIDEDTNPVEALKAAKEMVHSAQSDEAVATEEKVETLPEKKSKKSKSEMTPGSKKPKSAKKAEKEEEEDEESEEEINEEEVEGSEEDENDDESESEEEVEQEDEKPKRGGKSKSAVYDRGNDLHKNLVGKMLTHYFPDWRTKLKETAIQASKKMQGKEFLDRDGLILKSFEDEFVKTMKKKK